MPFPPNFGRREGCKLTILLQYTPIISFGSFIKNPAKTIKSIPLKLLGDNVPSILEIRGEIFLNKNKFEDLNKKRIKEGKEPFANPRNACAGSLKLLDPKEVSMRPLDAIFY